MTHSGISGFAIRQRSLNTVGLHSGFETVTLIYVPRPKGCVTPNAANHEKARAESKHGAIRSLQAACRRVGKATKKSNTNGAGGLWNQGRVGEKSAWSPTQQTTNKTF